MQLESRVRHCFLFLIAALALLSSEGLAAAGGAGAAPAADGSTWLRMRRTNSPGVTFSPPSMPARRPPAPTPSPELAARIKEANAFLIPTNTPATPARSADPVPGKPSSRDELLQLAARGNPSAQYLLGLRYLNGTQGAEKNLEKAKMLFELAATQGDANARKQLGLLKPAPPASETLKP